LVEEARQAALEVAWRRDWESVDAMVAAIGGAVFLLLRPRAGRA